MAHLIISIDGTSRLTEVVGEEINSGELGIIKNEFEENLKHELENIVPEPVVLRTNHCMSAVPFYGTTLKLNWFDSKEFYGMIELGENASLDQIKKLGAFLKKIQSRNPEQYSISLKKIPIAI